MAKQTVYLIRHCLSCVPMENGEGKRLKFSTLTRAKKYLEAHCADGDSIRDFIIYPQ